STSGSHAGAKGPLAAMGSLVDGVSAVEHGIGHADRILEFAIPNDRELDEATDRGICTRPPVRPNRAIFRITPWRYGERKKRPCTNGNDERSIRRRSGWKSSSVRNRAWSKHS